MKLQLTVWERIKLCMVVGSIRGVNMATIRKADKALDVLELSEEEEKAIGLVYLPTGKIRWKPDTDVEYVLEIKDKEAVHLVRKAFDEYSNWDTADRKLILRLEEKLGAAPKTKGEEG